jgi:triosephosphate isomerase
VRDKTLIIGNWKMNLNIHEASLFVHKLNEAISNHRNVEVVLSPTMLALQTLSLQIDHKKFKLAAQNLYWRDEGPFTGEVSAHQLRGLVKYAIIGHSDRRHKFHEHDKDIRAKVQAAVRNHITPVLCVGETAAEKADGETNGVLHDQIVGGLANLTAEDVRDMVIAYEPVWAISGGKNFNDHKTPTPTDIKKAVKTIRSQIEHLYGKETAKSVRVIYGGSSNGSNAASILSVDELDGLLPGGASLNIHEFANIIKAAHERDK